MRHFISFQKLKGLHIPLGSSLEHSDLVHQINHELMKYGFVLSRELFDVLATQSADTLDEVFNDLRKGLMRTVGGSGYQAIYENFPNAVLERSELELFINAVLHYWSHGTWRPSDSEVLKKEYAVEPVKLTPITLISVNEFAGILRSIVFSNSSISSFDKEIIDWYLANGYPVDFEKITFNETKSYVGKALLDAEHLTNLPEKNATTVLRMWSAYSGGDEGLKENTKLKSPSARQRKVILSTLEQCYNLEEAFKMHREKWLRMLYFLHPGSKPNREKFPIVAEYADKLRNSPKELKTFNARVEPLIKEKDPKVFELLRSRMGAFTRRLDHLTRVFGALASTEWFKGSPNLNQLITVYNAFSGRSKEQEGRGAILANSTGSEVVSYDALEPLDAELVHSILSKVREHILKINVDPLANRKVYIDRSLYYTPITRNNRASSLALDSKSVGHVEVAEEGKTLRMYVHWHGYHDIDLSGLVISKTGNEITFAKIGWNTSYRLENAGIVYSGDNTGLASQNAEYLDITPDLCAEADIEWVIAEARIYRGPQSFKEFNQGVRIGWMSRSKPDRNPNWMPETVEHATVLNNEGTTSYSMALHIPTRSIVYLDLAMGNNRVSTNEDALKMKSFLNTFVTVDDGSTDPDWSRLNLGHILHLLSGEVVEDKSEAQLVFDETTKSEEITQYL